MKLGLFSEETQRRPVKLAGVAATPPEVFPDPATTGLIDVSLFHGFAIAGTLRAGDVPVIELVAAKSASGTDLMVVKTIDLSAETVADGDQFMFDANSSCLDGCKGYSYVGIRITADDISGDVIFYGYNPAYAPVQQPETFYLDVCIECCCNNEGA